MKLNRFDCFVITDPVNLSIKGKALSVIACFIAIFFVAWLTRAFIGAGYPIVVASTGASAVMLFIIPHSPLVQPWPLLVGQLVSATVGMACAQALDNPVLAASSAVAGSVLAMLLLRCLHPPGTATALIPLISGHPITSLGYHFALVVELNIAILLILGIMINRWVLGHSYPIASPKPAVTKTKQVGLGFDSSKLIDIPVEDLEEILGDMDMFMDISPVDLNNLFTSLQKQRVKRSLGSITCADVMDKDVPTVAYGTEVEDAWNIMVKENLKAMPVIDRSRRVIGIISRDDFFKFINVDASGDFQEKFRAFIRRTPDISTLKPEAVGHIMTTSVRVLPENAHIVELVTLMATLGYRQVPIVNKDNRLVGMVYQANLIATLYNHQLESGTENV